MRRPAASGALLRRRAAPCVFAVHLLAFCAGTALAYETGHTSITFQDPARGNRSIPTEIYYPANVPGEGVPVAGGSGERFPVVAFGHGFLMVYSAYENVWEALAPAGYIVALPRTEGTVFPSHAQFGQDLAFVANAIRAEGANAASLFFEKVAASAAVAGHSMGGGASVLAAAGNANIQAVVNLAAAETNPSAIAAAASVEAPSLLFAGSLDCVTPPPQHQIPIYDAIASDCKTLVTILGASHCQFAQPNFNCGLGEGGCAPPAITRAQQHALVALLLVPWLDSALRDDGAAWQEFQSLLVATGGLTYLEACVGTDVDDGPLDDPMDDAPSPGATTGRGSMRVAGRPNPFRAGAPGERSSAGTTITITLSERGFVSVEIFDTSGRQVRALAGVSLAHGAHDVEWDGLDDRGAPLAPGVYLVRAASGAASATWSARLVR